MSGYVKEVVKSLHTQAAQAGQGAAFVDAYRKIIDRLQRDPLGFGEPLYSLPKLQLRVRQGALAPLVVVYGVHETKALVFIRGFKILA
jgi:hypothetical protein